MKALFFDIDGTIWNYKSEIPKSTVSSIRKAREDGNLCFLNSGRSRAFIRDERLLSIGFDGIVSGCGTCIEIKNELRFNKLIDKELSEFTVNTVRKYGFKPILEGPRFLYLDADEFEGDYYSEKIRRELGEGLLSINENFGKWEINKLSCETTDARREECFKALSPYYELIIHNESVCEIVPKGFNKGSGILKVLELLDIKDAETYAFGDSVNDVDMIRLSTVGIIMGSGTDAAKKEADYVTDTLENDGIEKAMKHFGII